MTIADGIRRAVRLYSLLKSVRLAVEGRQNHILEREETCRDLDAIGNAR